VPERDIVTPSGRQLTLMNPAYMTRQVYELNNHNLNAPQGHITSLKPIRPENAADPWERKALEFFEKGGSEQSEFQIAYGKPVFRFMRPLKVDKACLPCHAEQGYREGEIRGGISVTIPMADVVESTRRSSTKHIVVISLVWLLGVTGLWFGLQKVKRGSLALQEERNNLNTIFESSPVGIIMADNMLNVVRTNQAARAIFGGNPEATNTSVRCGDLLGCRKHSDAPGGCGFAEGNASCSIMSSVRLAVNDNVNTLHAECCIEITKNGVPQDIWLHFGTVPLERNGIRYALLSIEDVTDHKRTEQALVEKMDFTENLLQNSTTPTFVIDAQHRVLIWNRALERLTGIRSQELVGTTEQWRPFYPSPRPCLADIVLDGLYEESAELYINLTRSRLIPDGLHAEGDFSFAARRCRLVFSSAPIRNHEGQVIAAIETLEDITERISLEAQLFHAQKMESVGVLAGGIAHDFNNVLTVISGYAALLQLTTRGDERNQHIANEIADSVDRAADMTRSLLAFSGKHEIMLQYDDLNLILANIRKSMGRLIREDITLDFQTGAEQLQVYVDRVQIEQVLINLVVNARDALGADGKISVSSWLALFEEEQVEGTAVIPAGRYACMKIGDNGSGMSNDTIEHIFEPFFTTKEKGKGTGLGLAIVHSIVTKHNGYISVISSPGTGTEFRIYLPLFTGEMHRKQAAPVQTISHHGTETVLVVEDDIAIMKLHQEVLVRYGYTVLVAGDGVEALEVFNNHADEIQIVVVDVIMPRMNGRETVEELRKLKPKLPIIMTSGYTDEIVNRASLDKLRVSFLQKPVRPLDLLATIRANL
ncbi:MAG TPA: DUF3365 domain-containing protein, partial [Desulfuromonadales bacterium]|nr:DUF3365 domain-containing protein [Desulfuromonadales bacterium]